MQQLPLEIRFPRVSGRDDFIVSECNRLAAEWIDHWPNWPKPGHSLNIVGSEMAGKSHLAAIWQEVSGASLCNNPESLSKALKIEDIKLFILDNFHDCGTWPEETLFHLFNRCDQEYGGLLILSKTPVTQMNWHLADLGSRMRGVATASISPPDDALMLALLEKYFTDRQLIAPASMLAYLIARMERSFNAIQKIGATIDRLSISEKKPLSINLARLALAEEKVNSL